MKNQLISKLSIPLGLCMIGVILIVFGLPNKESASMKVADNSSNPMIGSMENIGEIQSCNALQDKAIQGCYDSFIKSYFGEKTTQEVLRDLEIARATDPFVESDCHPITHSIGRYTLNTFGNVGDAFDACDHTCHSGCYHGVMERMFFDEKDLEQGTVHLSDEIMKVKIPGICDPSNFEGSPAGVVFQCLHGLGHAIMYSTDYDLERSLAGCDLLESQYDRSSCYGGVIMENITAFDKSARDIDYSNANYPCNKLDTKYKYQCYLMQTSIMQEIGLSPKEQVEQCALAGEYKVPCFTSIGRDISNFYRLSNPEFAREVCEDYPQSADAKHSCIDGVAKALTDNTWDGSFSFGYCSSLNELDNRSYCYNIIVPYAKWTYGLKDAKLIEDCETYAGASSQLCKDSLIV